MDGKQGLLRAVRSVWMAGALGLFACLSQVSAVLAQDGYPSRSVNVIVPYSAGTGIDVLTRTVGRELAKRMNQSFVIDNRVGASGNIGIRLAAKSPPDGYNLLTVVNTFTLNPAVSAPGYDAVKDFAPIGMIARSGMVLVVNDSLPVSSLPELVDLIKRNPGKYFYASTGIGSPQHMSMELFKRTFHLDITHVPHASAAEANLSLLARQTNMMFMPINIALQPVRAGKIKALAVASAARDPSFPDIGTVAELGAPGFDVILWYGLLAPAGTPAPIVNKLSRNLKEILELPHVEKTLTGLGMKANYMEPAVFKTYIRTELARWNEIARNANIKAE